MNRMFSMMVVAITMLFTSISISAQNSNNQQRMSREQLAEKQARHIAHELALDDATTQKYVATYCAYQKEVWTLNPKVKGPKLTDEDVEKAIKENFENRHKILELREKYYKEYSKFLTQKQIQRAYELERQAMKRLSKRGHSAHRQHRATNRRRS